MAQRHKYDCKIYWLWVRSPLAEMKYLFTFIFSFPRFGVEAKRGVEFRHSTRNAFKSLKTRFLLPTPLCAGYSVKLKKKSNISQLTNSHFTVKNVYS